MKKIFLLFVCILFSPQLSFSAEKPIAREIVALYDSRFAGNSPRMTFIHNFLEMPANHMGYDINYYDIMAPLPKLNDDVAGVILWFDVGEEVTNPILYMEWIKENVIAKHKKLLIIENGGISEKNRKDPKIALTWNEILGYIGVNDEQNWDQLTYHAEIAYIDNAVVGFERKIAPPFPPISVFHVLSGSKAKVHLRMHLADVLHDENSDVVVTGQNGGFIAQGYAIFAEKVAHRKEFVQAWIVNPFTFLKQAFNPETFPMPDVTTLDGRRIFYSHIDGDGWNNISEIPAYREKNNISADVIYQEVLQPYSEFPFSVALITGDVDPNCFAVPTSEKVARDIFALPNVEPSSHTYSHPFFWDFFADYTPEKEKPLLGYYPMKPKDKFSAIQVLKKKFSNPLIAHQDTAAVDKYNIGNFKKQEIPEGAIKDEDIYTPPKAEDVLKGYDYMPRSYACSNYNLDQEISGSIETVKSLSPASKKVRLIQWSGDTSPYEAAIGATRKAGLLNINGGDSRFDKEFPSYSFVAPIGIKIGQQRQIYSSNSNEETYTDEWRDRFYGYRYLQETVKNTDKPVRLSPFNIYFHMFSGEKLAALNAIKENIEFARTQDIIPIIASDYAAIADGFYTAKIIPIGDHTWRIQDRGDLQTLRFDNADGINVNMDASKGVIGQYHYQGSLYVALDPVVKDASISITRDPAGGGLYLVQSNWQIKNMNHKDGVTSFEASGYGKADIVLQARAGEEYTVTLKKEKETSQLHVRASSKGMVHINIPQTLQAEIVKVSVRG